MPTKKPKIMEPERQRAYILDRMTRLRATVADPMRSMAARQRADVNLAALRYYARSIGLEVYGG